MTEIKKMYIGIMEFLERNKDELVSTVLPEIREYTKAHKKREFAPTFIQNHNGKTVAARCAYFRRWFPIVGELAVPFDTKEYSASGYKSMCSEGFKRYTEATRVAKASFDEMFKDMSQNGGFSLSDVDARMDNVEEIRRDSYKGFNGGFETRDAVIKHLKEIGILQPEANNE